MISIFDFSDSKMMCFFMSMIYLFVFLEFFFIEINRFFIQLKNSIWLKMCTRTRENVFVIVPKFIFDLCETDIIKR